MASRPCLASCGWLAQVELPDRHIGTVMSEITGVRRGSVLRLEPLAGSARQAIHALVPLASMVGYASALRSLTQGEATLSMEFSHYVQLDAHTQQQVLLKLRGY